MTDENEKPSFLGGIIRDRIEGLKDAARQGFDDVSKNVTSAGRTVDGVLRDTNTSYLETERDPKEPIFEVMAKGEGKNARVTLWPDRLEWEKGGGISGGKVFAAILTTGISLAFTGLRGKKEDFETLPLSAVVGVSIKRVEKGQIVSVSTAGGDIDFRVSRQNAAAFRVAILNQLQVREQTPTTVVMQGFNDSQGPSVDYAAQLRKLAALRDDGILTEAEFQEKKNQIMGKL